MVTYQPAVVLLDVNMPRRNGWEVLEAIKDHDETFEYPVIVCSIEDNKARAFRLGAADYLVKPFLEEDLLAAIRRVQLERNLPCVLVVDPNEESLTRTASALTKQEDVLRVIEARDSAQAIDMVANYRPSLVLLDMRSGTLDFKALVSAIREDPNTRGIRVLAVPSASIDGDDLMWLAGREVHFETGFTDNMILELVRTQLGMSGDGIPRSGSD
jgi:CheY-like chemotaxis protein